MAWVVDTVVNMRWPLEPPPDSGEWPETPDPLGHIVALLEDIRNLVSSAAPCVADGPGGVVPPTFPGHPNRYKADLNGAAWTLREIAAGQKHSRKRDRAESLRAIACRLEDIAEERPDRSWIEFDVGLRSQNPDVLK